MKTRHDREKPPPPSADSAKSDQSDQTTPSTAEGGPLLDSILRHDPRYQALILEIADDAIISINQDQQIILFNKGAEKIFGYRSAEVINRPLDILLPEPLTGRHRQHINQFASSGETARLMGIRQEVVGRRKNGDIFPAEASISQIDFKGELVLTVILRDITLRKQIEQERERLIDQLKALNEATQAINSRISLEQVLRTIVQAAQSLIKARYAALSMNDSQGRLARFITAGLTEEERNRIGALPIGRGLLGHFLREGQSLIINDLATHPESVGFPAHHPLMHKMLGVPIFSKGDLLGTLYLTDKVDGSDFNEAEQQLVEMLVRHAAVAIDNARLYEQNQQLAIVDERARFARDLHDSIIQSIYGVGLSLDQVRAYIPPESDIAAQMIDLSLKSLAGVIEELRNYIFDLRPQALGHKDLERRLNGLIKEIKINTHLPVEVEISPNMNSLLTESQARHLFHIAHEALANVARHAKAGHIWFSLLHQADQVALVIKDDGLGFTPPDDIIPGHHGLANIRARAEQLGATYQLESEPGRGTQLSLSFPVNRPTN